MTREEKFNDYDGFVEKFKPKKTTDDCYTPPEIYEAVKLWACKKYGIDPTCTVRPFWHCGNYEAFDYPDGAVVLDNPPFSCLAKIVQFYTARKIPYFLFAPGLTAMGLTKHGAGIVYTDTRITYKNGAKVNTCFATSFGNNVVESAPDLGAILKAAQHSRSHATPPVYQYPPNLLTTQSALALARHGVQFALPRTDAVFVRALDAMKAEGKEAFGGALLISNRAATCKSAAEQSIPRPAAAVKVWELSEREKKIVQALDQGPASQNDRQGLFCFEAKVVKR